MRKIQSKQLEFPLSGSFTGSFAGNASGLTNITASAIDFNLFQITSGSVSASVNTDPNNLFLIKSGSSDYFKIASTETTLYSDLFIVKNFTTQQAVFSVSQSVVQFATQSTNPVGVTEPGTIWFTPTVFYVGLE